MPVARGTLCLPLRRGALKLEGLGKRPEGQQVREPIITAG